MSTKTALSNILRAATGGNGGGSGGDKPQQYAPKRTEPTVETPSPMARQRAQQAADAAQYTYDLEMDVNAVRAELAAANSRVMLLDGANEQLHADLTDMEKKHEDALERLRFENQRLTIESTAIMTDLHTVTKILLDIKMRTASIKAPVSEYAPKPKGDEGDRAEQAGREFAQGDLPAELAEVDEPQRQGTQDR